MRSVDCGCVRNESLTARAAYADLCAVVTSAGTPMAELGDVVTVDPYDVESIRDGIARAHRPEPRRGASWDDVAAQTLAVYEELA